MRIKAILIIFYVILGIYSMIVYLRYSYKKYEVLTVADILVSLLIIVGWPLPLLMLLVHYFLLFICKLEEIVILRKK
jgi:hypothetical protein